MTNNTLSLTDEHARMGKISNNLEKHGEEDVTAFAIPFEIMLPPEQLNALMGEYFDRSLFNTQATTGLKEPVAGFRRCKPLELEDNYEKAKVLIGLSGDNELEFEDCQVRKFILEPQVGGLTKLTCQVYLRPGIGAENLALQEHQHREVSVVISEGKVALKKNPKQQTLPLESPKDAAGEQVTAETDAALDQAIGRPPAVESRGGEAIDAELHARHPEASAEVMGADANAGACMDPELESEMQQFEEGARQRLADFQSVSERGVIDGRSERVKHQDEQLAAAEGEPA